MNKIRNILLITIISAFILGCSASKEKTQNVTLPSWFVNPSAQDAQNLYGTSSAFTLEEAKKQALKNISSYLSLELNSSTNIQKSTSAGFYEKNITQNINSSTKKIQFTNSKIVQNKIIDSKFYVLVQVNKNKLFNENKNILENSDKNITNKINNSKNKSLLERIKTLSSLNQELKDSKDKAYILYAIDDSFDYKSYVSKYQNLLNEKDVLISKLIINVIDDSNNKSSKYFMNELINFFNNNSYKVSTNNVNVKSKISVQLNYSKYKDWFITKSITSIKIQANGKTISNNVIKAVGRSSSNQENANVSASIRFKKELKKLSINKILFSE